MDWNRQYFVLPDCCIAFNAKVASSALACSIAKTFYPHLLDQAKENYETTWSKFSDDFKKSLPESFQRMLAEDWDSSKAFYQNVCPRTDTPDKPVLLAVRSPLDRFVCTVAYMGLDVDDTLVALENKERRVLDTLPCLVYRNTHFLPQSIYDGPSTTCYKFPDRLEDMCRRAGLAWPLPRINTGRNEKPKLTSEQESRVKAIYREDFDLYESI